MAKNKKRKSADLRVITEEHPKFVGRIATIFVKYRNVFGYALMGLLVITVLFLLMQHNNRVKNNEASAMLQNALDQYQRDLAASTISIQTGSDDNGAAGAQLAVQARSPGSFQAVYDNYPGTYAGRNALYMAATSHLNLGDNQKALDAFNRFIQSYPNDPLTPSAKLARATALFNDGQTTESLELLYHIERTYPDFRLLDVVTYEIAKRYESLERWSDAGKTYETLMERYPDSSFKSMSDNALKKIEHHLPASDSDTASVLS